MLFQSSRRLEFNSIAFDCELLRNDAVSNAKKSFSLSNSFSIFFTFYHSYKRNDIHRRIKREKKATESALNCVED